MLLLSVIFLLWSSVTVGLFAGNKIGSSFKWYKSPLGFFLILGGYQITTFPMMLFRLNLSIVYGWTMLFLITLLILNLLKLRQVVDYIKEISKTKQFFFCVCFSAVLIIIYSRLNILNTLSDFNFYIPLVGTNNHGGWLNSYDPWSGVETPLSWMYNFQGYYLFLSSLSYLFRIHELLLMIWLPSSLFFIILPLMIFDVMKIFSFEKLKVNQYVVFAVIFLLSQLDLFFMEFVYYGNNFRGYVFLYLLMLVQLFFNTKNAKLIYVILILSFAHLSLQSTALFISIIILTGIVIYDQWKNKSENIDFTFWFTVPIFCYGFCIIFLRNSWMGIFLLAIYYCWFTLLKFMINRNCKKLIERLVWFVLALLVLGVYSFSIVMEIRNGGVFLYIKEFIKLALNYFSADSSRSIIDYLQVLLWGGGLICLVINVWKEKKKSSFLQLLPLITIIVFINPFVFAFVSTYLTGIVYDRTFIMIYSMLTIGLIVQFILKKNQGKIVLYFMLGLSLVIFVDTLKEDHFQDKLFKQEDSDVYSMTSKLPNDLIDVAEFLEDYIDSYYEGDYTPTILSSDLRLRLIYNSNYLKFTVSDYRYSTILDEENQNYWLTYLYKLISDSGNPYFISADLSQIPDLFKSQTIEYILTPSYISVNLENTLSSFCRWIYGNESYRVYQVIL